MRENERVTGTPERLILVIGDVFPLAQSRLARALQRAASAAMDWLVVRRRLRDASAVLLRSGRDGATDARRGVSPGAAADGGLVPAMEATLAVTRQWSDLGRGATAPSCLGYRGLCLTEMFQDPLMWMLARFLVVEKTIANALNRHKPRFVAVRDPRSLEKRIAETLARAAQRPFEVQALAPAWLASLQWRLHRLGRLAHCLLSEWRVVLCIGEVDSGGREYASAGDETHSVFFFSAGVTSTRTTLPVLQELARRGGVRLQIAFPARLEEEVRQAVADAGWELRRVERFRPGLSLRTIAHLVRLPGWRRELRSTGIQFSGTPLTEILQASPTEFCDYTVAVVKTWIDSWRERRPEAWPRLLITGNDRDWRVKTVAAMAKSHGTVTVSVQDGMYGPNPRLGCTGSDHVVVGGEAVKAIMTGLGVPERSIHILGVPRYDTLTSGPRRARVDVCADLRLDPGKPVIVMATDHSVDPSEKMSEVRAMMRAAAQISGAQLVFKLHPYEQDGLVEATVSACRAAEGVRVVQRYGILDLVEAADVVVTRHSSVGVEAMALGKPVLVLNLTGDRDATPYVAEKAALGVYREADLVGALRTLLGEREGVAERGRAAADFVRRYLGAMDGKADVRVADLVEGLVLSGADERKTADGWR